MHTAIGAAVSAWYKVVEGLSALQINLGREGGKSSAPPSNLEESIRMSSIQCLANKMRNDTAACSSNESSSKLKFRMNFPIAPMIGTDTILRGESQNNYLLSVSKLA